MHRTPADPSPQQHAEDVVHALNQAIRRRQDARSTATLDWFDSARGSPPVAVDGNHVAAFVRTRWNAVAALLRRRDDRVRHAAIWALVQTGESRVAPLVVDLLLHQRDFFDHDFAYVAARCLGPAGIAAFARIARHGSAEASTMAIECIGHSRAGRLATTALRGIARRRGLSAAIFNAIYNLHDPALLPLALRGLTSREPQRIQDAMSAVLGCLESQHEVSRAAARPAARRIARVLAEPRIWHEHHDPWISTCAFGLESLVLLRAPEARALARRALRDPECKPHLDSARQALRALRRRPRHPAARPGADG